MIRSGLVGGGRFDWGDQPHTLTRLPRQGRLVLQAGFMSRAGGALCPLVGVSVAARVGLRLGFRVGPPIRPNEPYGLPGVLGKISILSRTLWGAF